MFPPAKTVRAGEPTLPGRSLLPGAWTAGIRDRAMGVLLVGVVSGRTDIDCPVRGGERRPTSDVPATVACEHPLGLVGRVEARATIFSMHATMTRDMLRVAIRR